MSEKIPVAEGAWIEPDDGAPSPFRRRITDIRRIPGTLSGHDAVLDCGHSAQIFGKPGRTGGSVLCMRCREEGTQ